jgi:hypothetical protein
MQVAKSGELVNKPLPAWYLPLKNMADVHTPQQRRFNMQQIRSTNTKPEMLVRKFLFANGYRYRLHDKKCKYNKFKKRVCILAIITITKPF